MIETDPAYGALKAHLIATTGLEYYSDRDEDLAERIGRRLAELGLSDCAAYAGRLANDGLEMDAIIARLNIGETYFFRDGLQFDAIRDVIMPEILRRKQLRSLRIWSAGCANGCEPYSLSILLGRDLMDQIAGWQVTILATDNNRRSLEDAREGRFGDWALRSTSDEVKQQCFSNDGVRWTIHNEHKERISFEHLNLVSGEFPSPDSPRFDLILCRNVMIYFSAEVKRRLIRQFRESLTDGGWLLVGVVEHDLENFKSFRAVPVTGATLYQKMESLETGERDCQPECRLECRLDTACSPVDIPSPQPYDLPQASPEPERPPESPNIEGLRQLADKGDWESAVRYSHQLLGLDGLNPVVHFYHALVLEQVGIPGDAERSLRQAIYLDRHFLLAHYHLGLALARVRKPRLAIRSFENVLALSSGMQAGQTLLYGDGATVANVRDLATMHLHSLGVL